MSRTRYSISPYPPLSDIAITVLSLLLVLASTWICAGFFLSPFMHDDLFFIHISLFDYDMKHYQAFIMSLRPVVRALSFEDYWMLRVLYLALAVASGFFVYRILGLLLDPMGRKGLTAVKLLASTLFVSILTYFRGYEVRAEAVANASLLLCGWALLALHDGRWRNGRRLALIASCMFLAALTPLWSLRYAPAAFAFLVAYCMRLKESHGVTTCWKTVSVTFGVALLVYLKMDFLGELMAANKTRNAFPVFSLSSKISGGEWKLAFPAKIGMVLLLTQHYLRKFLGKALGLTDVRLLFPVLLLSGFYGFLIFLDTRPFEFVRTIEWTILFITLGWTYLNETDRKGHWLLWVLSAAMFLLASVEANYKIWKTHNTARLLRYYSKQRSEQELRRLPVEKLIEAMIDNRTIVEQMTSRKVFREKYPDADFYTQSMKRHPVIIRKRYREAFYQGAAVPPDVDTADFKNFMYIGDDIPAKYKPLITDDFYLYREKAWIRRQSD